MNSSEYSYFKARRGKESSSASIYHLFRFVSAIWFFGYGFLDKLKFEQSFARICLETGASNEKKQMAMHLENIHIITI